MSFHKHSEHLPERFTSFDDECIADCIQELSKAEFVLTGLVTSCFLSHLATRYHLVTIGPEWSVSIIGRKGNFP
jgi:hypothetical protein